MYVREEGEKVSYLSINLNMNFLRDFCEELLAFSVQYSLFDILYR